MCLDGKDGPAKLPMASSQELLEQLVRSELNSDEVTIALAAGSNKGDNYMGVIFRAQAECRRTGKKLSVIIKLPPQNEARRNQFFSRVSFEREISFYTEIYPMMAEFQREKGINLMADEESDAFNQIPHCYRTSLVEFEEAILMGDLKDLGFEMFDRHQELLRSLRTRLRCKKTPTRTPRHWRRSVVAYCQVARQSPKQQRRKSIKRQK